MRRRSLPGRVSGFSDAVFAVLITVLVLDLRPPAHPTYAAMLEQWPRWLSYGVSYLFIAIVWANHHYLLRYASQATPRLVWFNFAHLFSMSLLPLATSWMATSELAPQPVSFYAAVFFLVNATYVALIWELIETNPAADATPRERRVMRWRSLTTTCLFGAAAIVALWDPIAGLAICIGCLAVYLRPDPAGWRGRAAKSGLSRPQTGAPLPPAQANPSANGETRMISAEFPYQKQRRRVLGREMAYVETGQGDPIVLLHGNPTSSYLWRNVLPHLKPLGRCIAPDLIGMGDSDKLPDSGPGSYRFVEHRRYLDALLEALDVRERVTLVIHDWGSALGFDWANRHRDAVKGIAFMEAIAGPQGPDHWDKIGMRAVLEALRSPAGEEMVLQGNFFIEEILPNAILRKLSPEEMAEYRRPFAEPGEGRRPTLTWPREIPVDGEPADVNTIAMEYAAWLGTSPVPKLFLKAEPGAIFTDRFVDLVRGWPALTEKAVVGLHFVQEDSPEDIGMAIVEWMAALGDGARPAGDPTRETASAK